MDLLCGSAGKVFKFDGRQQAVVVGCHFNYTLMIAVFLLLLVAFPLTLTHLLRRFFFDNLNFSALSKKVLLILTYVFLTIAFICSALYFSFGPLFYGHRQATQFYNSHKNELLYLITRFAALEKNGLFSISKSSEGNLKITLELSNGKGTTEFLVNDKEGKYQIARMSNNQPDLIYNPNQPASLSEILNQNKPHCQFALLLCLCYNLYFQVYKKINMLFEVEMSLLFRLNILL